MSLANTMRARATARVEAVASEKGEGLIEFLRAYKGAVQEIVNELWRLKKTPSKATLHRAYYDRLRGRGFRAHHVSEIYKRAREVVRAAKSNAGSRPLLKKLTARIHPLDYKIDLKAKALRLAILNDEWIELKLKWYDYLDKYLEGSWRLREVLVSYKHGGVFAYLVFNKEVQFKEPKTIMGVDLNFDNATCTIVDLDGNLTTIYPLPYRGLRRALHLKKLAERLQKGHPKSWRFQKWVKKTRAGWLRRAKSILIDSAHYLAKRLVKITEEYEACIAFEGLKKVKENGNCDGDLAWEVQLWCYRRVQEFAEVQGVNERPEDDPRQPEEHFKEIAERQAPQVHRLQDRRARRGRDFEGRDSLLEHSVERTGEVEARKRERREKADEGLLGYVEPR